MKRFAVVFGLAFLVLPATAFGQATRTWVSGVGDDANPCSRTAPCKTWAGAISKTATGGEMDALDPGGFGAVTITKSITIDGASGFGSILASGTNGVIINITNAADVQKKVTLRNLDINGTRGAVSPGLNGVRVLAAKRLRILNTRIFDFNQSAITLEAGIVGGVAVLVDDSVLEDSTLDGININPPTSGTTRVTVRDSRIVGNDYTGVQVQFAGGPGLVRVNASNNVFVDNDDYGVFTNGSFAKVSLSNNDISGSNNVAGFGMRALNGSEIRSFGNNHLDDNTTNGVPTTIVAPL